jgi:dTDP-glucose pyrophosphorylase
LLITHAHQRAQQGHALLIVEEHVNDFSLMFVDNVF